MRRVRSKSFFLALSGALLFCFCPSHSPALQNFNLASNDNHPTSPAFTSRDFESVVSVFRRLIGSNQDKRPMMVADNLEKLANTTDSTGSKPVTISKSPVAIFRHLLSLNPEQQKQFLSNKSEQDREEIIVKLSEYKALKPDERELKLKATELHWYLRPFLYAPESERTALLASVPSEYRKMVQERLRYLDHLSTEARKKLQTNESMLVFFSIPVHERIFIIATNSYLVNEQLAELQAMPEEQRQKALDGFKDFFELSSADKQKMIHTLSEADRQTIAKTLKEFESLPPAQRSACIESFSKLAEMPTEQRTQFLKNAAWWRMMTPEERQQWRNLVEDINAMPPSPPGFPQQQSPASR